MTTTNILPSIYDLSLYDLVALKSDIEKQISKIQRVRKSDILKQMNALAKEAGYSSVADVVEGSGRKPRADKGIKLPPKYQNPDDSEKTWSGKGRAPQWILDYEKKKGKSRDDLLIGE